VCDLETSRVGAPCIYDISRLRVKGYSVKRFDMINPKYSCNPHYFHRSLFNNTSDS